MEFLKTGNSYVVRLDRGEEVVSKLTELCREQDIRLGSVYAIGACDYIKVGLYNVEEQKYHSTEKSGPMEITSIVGNITRKDGEVYLHLHINVCDEDIHAFGGHLNECHISATCEMMVTVLDGEVGRRIDDETGLNVFKF